jgi:hypothetical protein
VRELNQELREGEKGFSSDIRARFPGKASARQNETRTIKTFRRIYGQDSLPGNRSNH